jgi:hypothetical protein
MYKKLLALALVLVIALTAAAVLAQTQTQTQAPSGTIRITLNSASAMMGASWGQASLLFQGKAHRFRVRGLKVGSVGIRRIAFRGDVYNLNNVNDFAGTFRNAPPGLTFIVGERGLVLQNDKGVTLNLVAQQRGLNIDLIPEGLIFQPVPK